MEPTSRALVLLIKKIAESKGITQLEMSEKSGIAQSNVSATFAGLRTPNLSTFVKLCSAVGVRIFIEDRDEQSDLSKLFQEAMDEVGFDPQK